MIGRIGRMWNVGLGDGSGILAGSLGSQVVVEGMREISHKLPGRKYHFNLFLTPFQTSTNKRVTQIKSPKPRCSNFGCCTPLAHSRRDVAIGHGHWPWHNWSFEDGRRRCVET